MTQPAEADAQPQGTFWLLDLNQPLPVGLIPRVPTTFMRVGPELAQELAQAMQLDNPSVVLQRFARGCHCYAGRIEGELATYGWVTFDEEDIGELGLPKRHGPGWLPARNRRLHYPRLNHAQVLGTRATRRPRTVGYRRPRCTLSKVIIYQQLLEGK